ncbi:MAG: uracil-DNA glycosylase [Planctomycetota bacterium]
MANTNVNEANELERALGQVLERYRQCGVRRFHRSSPDDELLAKVDALGAVQAANVRGTAGAAATLGSPSANSNAESNLKSPAPRKQASAPAVPASSPGEWQLPVLSDAERTRELSEIDQEVRGCRACKDIVSFRQQTVFGAGPLNPTVCFMGEAPGADEDRQGVPFVGKAGQLLTKIIAAMKLKRDEVYILNALKCRPPQNRTPVPDEIEHCRHFVTRQLETLQPQYIVCLGAVAVRSILDSTLSIGRLRGRFHHYRGAQVVVTYHPSYLLRNESAKRLVWDDMKMLMAEMGQS